MTAVVTKTSLTDLVNGPDVLTSEERSDKEKELDKLFNDKGLARYKLEILFSHKHTSKSATAGIVTWWESGAKLHGGGDAKIYLCDSVTPGEYVGCKKFIPDSSNGLSVVVCPHCMRAWNPEQLVGEMYYKLPLEKWSEVIHNWFCRLDHCADIYMKYGRIGIKEAYNKDIENRHRDNLLKKARDVTQRSLHIYPLKNIIKDTSAGADLQKRILAFLRA